MEEAQRSQTAERNEKMPADVLFGPSTGTLQNEEHLKIRLGGLTLRNEELIRQHFAMKDFIASMTDTIAMHQYTDKEAPTAKLAKNTENSFYMKE